MLLKCKVIFFAGVKVNFIQFYDDIQESLARWNFLMCLIAASSLQPPSICRRSTADTATKVAHNA